MKRALLVAAALVAVVAAMSLPLPPAGRALPPPVIDDSVAGAFHVHTNRSDGLSSPDDVAAAAARAGLSFVIFTDHGDGATAPEPPAYRHGVLCLDGVEVSAIGGHYVAIDLPQAPYPLGGEARDVVEDVRRLGGLGIVAHPDSPMTEQAWSDWTLPVDAVEVANLDAGWRQHVLRPGLASKRDLLRALITYPLRGEASLARLMSGSGDALRRFDEAARGRRVVALAGADVHAKLDLRNADPGDNRFALPFPGYERVFRSMVIRVRIEQPLSGDAESDAGAVIAAIRRGAVHAVARGLAWPAAFTFTAENAKGTAGEGGLLEAAGPVTLRVSSNAPPGFTTEIRRNGEVVATEPGADVMTTLQDVTGVYRVEIRAEDLPGRPAWILSNAIYVGSPPASPPAAAAPARVLRSRRLFDGVGSDGWRVETDETSLGALNLTQRNEGAALGFRFGLSGGTPLGQFAAAAVHFDGGIGDYTHLTIRASADEPRRVSVRARATVGDREHTESWQRSIYLDEHVRAFTIPFDDMRPLGTTSAPRPVAPSVYSILLVAGAPNTAPGASGWVYILGAALERRE